MENQWVWWIVSIVLVVIEVSTGTFYLLMVALGTLVGGIAAWLGLSIEAQLIIAAVVAAVGCVLVQRRKANQPAPPAVQRDANVHIDVGNLIHVDKWNNEGQAHVHYRGALWQARLDHFKVGHDKPEPGAYRIVGFDSNTILLKAQ